MKTLELTDKEFQIIMWALQAFRVQKKEDISRRSFAKWYAANNSGGWVPGTERRGTMEDISIMEHLENRLEKQVTSHNDDRDFMEGFGTPYGEPCHLDQAIEGQEEHYEEEIELYKTWGGD